MPGEVAFERGDHAQSGVFVRSGIVEHAVQQGQFVALGLNPLHGLGNFVQVRRARRKNDGLAEITKDADKGLVGDI